MYDVSENTTPANIVKLLSGISFVHSYNTLASTSEHFHTKESAQWQTKCFSHVLGSKFGTGYFKFFKKKKSLEKKTPILTLTRLLWKWEENSLVLYFYSSLLFSLVSLAWVSSETHNLQRIFRVGRGGVLPHIDHIGMCGTKGYGF